MSTMCSAVFWRTRTTSLRIALEGWTADAPFHPTAARVLDTARTGALATSWVAAW